MNSMAEAVAARHWASELAASHQLITHKMLVATGIIPDLAPPLCASASASWGAA